MTTATKQTKTVLDRWDFLSIKTAVLMTLNYMQQNEPRKTQYWIELHAKLQKITQESEMITGNKLLGWVLEVQNAEIDEIRDNLLKQNSDRGERHE